MRGNWAVITLAVLAGIWLMRSERAYHRAEIRHIRDEMRQWTAQSIRLAFDTHPATMDKGGLP